MELSSVDSRMDVDDNAVVDKKIGDDVMEENAALLNSTEIPTAEHPSVISWGRSDFGGLLRRRGEEDSRDGLSLFQLSGRSIVGISSNVYHTAAVTATGELFTCGQNDQGQVSDDISIDIIEKPRLMESLANHRVVSVSCGLYHTCVVTASGCAVSFGGNENGQLGHSLQKTLKVGPRVVNFLLPPRKVPLVISKVACGDLFSLFLTTTGEVYGCGSAVFLGNPVRGSHLIVSQAERIEALVGSNIINISAGSSHSFALSASGDLYSWGSNKYSELGVESVSSKEGEFHEQIPRLVSVVSDIGQILGISAGYSHSVLWTSRGFLYGVGNNKYGQLGLMLPRVHSFTRIDLPQYCTMAVCGSNHTLVLCVGQSILSIPSSSMISMAGASIVRVPSITSTTVHTVSPPSLSANTIDSVSPMHDTKLYGFGANMMNQVQSKSDAASMCRTPEDLSPELARCWSVSEVLYIGAGGDHSFAITTTSQHFNHSTKSSDLLRKQFSTLVSKAVIPMSASQMNNLIEKAQHDPDGSLQPCLSTVVEIFSSPSLLSASFNIVEQNRDMVDAVGLEQVYASLLRLHASALPRILGAIQQTLTELESALLATNKLTEMSNRVFAILWQAPLMGETVLSSDLFVRLMRLIYRHRVSFRRYLCTYAKIQYPMHIFVARFIKSAIAHLNSAVAANRDLFATRFQQSQAQTRGGTDHHTADLDNVALFCKMLHVLYMSTTLPRSNGVSIAELPYQQLTLKHSGDTKEDKFIEIPFDAFHSTSLSSLSDAALVMDVIHARDIRHRHKNGTLATPLPDEENDESFPTPNSGYFYVSNYPYLLTVDAKRSILLAEAMLHQQAAQRQAVTQGILLHGGVVMPWFILPVERQHLLQQTLIHIQNASPLDIKKPLKVVFIGEEGIDEGGVKKELFQLLIVQLFDLAYGMFVQNSTGRYLWVNNGNVWSDDEYRLVGSILALAVYNNVILDTHLPPIFYKKLLQDLPVTLEDLQALDPELYKGLQQLLTFPQPELVEDTFCRTFSVDYEVFGAKVVHDLVPNGRDIPVTGDNRQEFVTKYIQWLLDDSVSQQFMSLREGFSRVIPPEQLQLLTPADLELLIAGMPHLDFHALESSTEYIGDATWTAQNETIIWFWRAVHAMSLEDKQRLLKFITGTHKAPIGGLKSLGLKIQRAGPDSTSLPTAHTCFNTLILPAYATEEKLQDRLTKAIYECEGFGLK